MSIELETKVTYLAELFEQLKKTTGRLDKEKLVSENIQDSDFRETITFLCNNFVKTNVSKSKIKKTITAEQDFEITDYQKFMYYLNNYVSGKDSSVKSIQNYIENYSGKEKEFLTQTAIKNLKFGVTVKTLNKILVSCNYEPLFVFNVQLAESYKKYAEKELVKNPNSLGHFFITQKLDGVRCLAIKEKGQVTFYSRSGRTYEDLIEVEKELLQEKYPDNFIYDGEVLAENPENMNSGDLYRRTMTVMASKKVKTEVEFFIFDSFPLEQFKKGESELIYSKRREYFVDRLIDSEHIKILPVLYEGQDVSKIEELGEYAIQNNLEGIMLNKNTKYLCKRTKNLLKYKQFISCDAEIVGVYEGANKFEGMLGGLKMRYYDEIINVGGGFTDNERLIYWENPELVVGKLGTYEYTEKSYDANGNLDLRFSRWKGLRPDKTLADVSYDN